MIAELSYQTRLPLVAVEGQTFMVRLPDGSAGYLASGEVKRTDELVFSEAGAVEEAMQYIGLPYIWGGRMVHAPDSSSSVREEEYDGGAYGEEYWGARRYAP